MVRGINPALTTLERACDPKYVVVARATRRGARQPRKFDPSQLRAKFNTEKAKLHKSLKEANAEGGPEHDSDRGAVSTPPTESEEGVQPRGTGSGGPESAAAEEAPDRETGPGPGVGGFLMPPSDAGRPDPGEGGRRPRDYGDTDTSMEQFHSLQRRNRRAVRREREMQYGHYEDDMEFFARKYGDAQDALQHLDLGDNFRYLSNRAFKKHFPQCDFQKAMKTGGLPKFDGTVNLEMALSTCSDHVISALQRHVGVYGPADYINSDQAPGYVKARKLIRERASLLTSEGWTNLDGPRWNINLPYSPTWSSHVEAMVKITKTALKKLYTEPTMTKLTADEFYTQLKRCQGYINMRPLTGQTTDGAPLTPADFTGTGCNWLVSFLYEPENKGALGHRYEQL